jgi:uncharacterized protein YukE
MEELTQLRQAMIQEIKTIASILKEIDARLQKIEDLQAGKPQEEKKSPGRPKKES